MYEITYSLNGVVKTMMISARHPNEINGIMLNMFSGQNYEILNVVRRS